MIMAQETEANALSLPVVQSKPNTQDGTNIQLERLRYAISGLKRGEAPLLAVVAGRVEAPPVGSRTPDLELSSPSAASDLPGAGPTATHMSDDHTKSTTSLGGSPPLHTTAAAGGLLDHGTAHKEDLEAHSSKEITTPASSTPCRRSSLPTGGRTSTRGGPSTYRGVVWHKSNSKWEARIYESGKQKFLGYFTDENAAALAYDDYAIRIHGKAAKLNFPERYNGVELPPPMHPPPIARKSTATARSVSRARPRAVTPTTLGAGKAAASPAAMLPHATRRGGLRVQPVKGSSRYRGVSWNSNCSKWRAQVWKGSEVHHLGYFEREEDAARAYDEAVLRIRGPEAPTNYPRTQYGLCLDDQEDAPAVGSAAAQQTQHAPRDDGSTMLGVSWNEVQHAWIAEIWDGKKYKTLGAFSTETAAAKAYDVACLAQHGSDALTNFPLSTYEIEMAALALRFMAADYSGAEELYSCIGRAATPPVSSLQQQISSEKTETETDSAHLSHVVASIGARSTPTPPSPLAEAAGEVSGEEGNTAAFHRGVSKYQGVSWDRRKGRWFSQIQIRGNRKFLGYFEDELAAAKAYDLAASKLHGVNAALNFPATVAVADASGCEGNSGAVSAFRSASAGNLEVVGSKRRATGSHPTAYVFNNPSGVPAIGNFEALANKLIEYTTAQQQQQMQRQLPVLPLTATQLAATTVSSGTLGATAAAAMAHMVQTAIMAKQQETAAAMAAAWEEKYAAQQRMALASAVDQWARFQQALHQGADASTDAGLKRGFQQLAPLQTWNASKKPRAS